MCKEYFCEKDEDTIKLTLLSNTYIERKKVKDG